MALLKPHEQPTGHTASYHRITSIVIDGDNIRLEVASYKDEAARDADKAPSSSASYRVARSADMTMAGFYSKLKELPEFSGSQDC